MKPSLSFYFVITNLPVTLTSRLILLNKLLEDGNMLYRKNRPSEAAHRYQYALKKINTLISDEGLSAAGVQPVPHEHISAFVQLKTHLLLNLSRCKRKLNVSVLIDTIIIEGY